MKENKTWITIGKVGAPYGVKGWLKVHPYTEFDTNMLDYAPSWHLQNTHQQIQPIKLEEGKPYADGLVVKFQGIENPEDARQFTNQLVVIERSILPKLAQDEFYWSDLIGLKVIDQHEKILGEVIYLMETGSNDVIVIKDESGKEHAIPYLKDSVIQKVDLDAGAIVVDWELI